MKCSVINVGRVRLCAFLSFYRKRHTRLSVITVYGQQVKAVLQMRKFRSCGSGRIFYMRPRKKRHRAHSSHTRDIYAQVSLDATNHLGRSLFIYCFCLFVVFYCRVAVRALALLGVLCISPLLLMMVLMLMPVHACRRRITPSAVLKPDRAAGAD